MLFKAIIYLIRKQIMIWNLDLTNYVINEQLGWF